MLGVRVVGWCLCFGLAVSGTGDLLAQATTTGAVRGTVTDTAGGPVVEATVLATNVANGERWETASDARGRYYLDHLSVGGPYRVEARAIGFEPHRREQLFVSLGQRLEIDFVLTPAAFRLEEIAVAAEADPRINPGRTGPAQIITQSTIARLPMKDRDLTTLAFLVPQVAPSFAGGLSFAGQHHRLNSLQVDGATHNSFLAASGAGGIGTPPGFFPQRAFTPEAIKEIQVAMAPFDVRYGNFAGGIVSAVTKSGTNRFEGTLFGYFESEGLTGADSSGNRGGAFARRETGFVLGGPILRDRLAFFLDAGYRRWVLPQEVPAPTSDTTGGADSAGVGIRYESLTRFQEILRGYGVDPGDFAREDDRVPSSNIFGKLTTQLGLNSRLEMSHSRLRTTAEGPGFRVPGFYELSSRGSESSPKVDATRLNWTAAFGRRISNELVLARLAASSDCVPRSSFPVVTVSVDDGAIRAGTAPQCLASTHDEQIWELTDNLSVTAGAHRLTFGSHGELITLTDGFISEPVGFWVFESLDALQQGLPVFYRRDVPNPLQPEGDRVDFKVRQIGFYAQNEWSPARRVTLTAGVRVDVPFFRGAPVANPALQSELGIDNSVTPSGNILWSPRIGVSWDVSGRGSTYVRGGIGVFAGRLPYVWAAEVYRRTGLATVRVTCLGDNVPAFTLDPANQPSSCAGFEAGIPLAGYFDSSFRFPRNLKIALGADHRLPWGVVGTVDVLYTRGLNQPEWVDRNLAAPIGSAAGEGGRALYGTIDPADGFATPNRLSGAFESVIQLKNGSGDRAWSLTGQLQKRFASGAELGLAYTFTDAENRVDAGSDLLFSNFATTVVSGTLERRNTGTSFWERRHKVTAFATLDLPLKLRFGLFYAGYSGVPFTYTTNGDVNADGVGVFFDSRHNDPVYVPRDANDVSLLAPEEWDALDAYIEAEPCLRRQRGQLLQRNSCRTPWVNETQARLSTVIPTGGGQSLQVSADFFNVLNFLDGDWGLVRRTFGPRGTVDLLALNAYDTASQRGVYAFLSPERNAIDANASRWRAQISVRYAF